MANITHYSRLEPRPRDNDFSYTLAAQIRDPLWFLSRQWQMGEFAAEDTGSLAFAQYRGHTSRMPRWLLDGTPVEVDEGAPLEPQTLREPFEPDLALQVELGHDFADYLRDEVGDEAAANALLLKVRGDAAFLVADLPDAPVLDPEDPATRRFLSVCAGRTLNGYRLYVLGRAIADGSEGVPSSITTVPEEVAQIEVALSRLVSRAERVFGQIGTGDPATWRPGRLEYRLQVVGADPSGVGNVTHDAHPDSDGEYEWFSFDAVSRDVAALEQAAEPEAFSIIPARVHFDGMPATRFWNFEENTLALPDVQATGKDDLLKLLVTDFLLIHGNDWYVLPFQQKVGTLAKTHWIVVHDVFGKKTVVRRADALSSSPGADRWTMFSISDASGPIEGLTDYFILPPSAGEAMQLGSVLEDVRFARDETANLAFAIENITSSAIGEPRSGRERNAQIDMRRNLATPVPTNDFPLRYRIESEIPANWAPLLPVRIAPDPNPAIALAVGNALKATGGDEPEPVPRLSKILNPNVTGVYQIQEEEIPRTGLRVERVVYRARWIDGSTHLWVQRRRRVGAGESQSGLQFDQPLPNVT
jgi:hypothetical protein